MSDVRTALRDVLDAFFDMSPLEYARSRGLDCMSEAEGDRILARARESLDAATPNTDTEKNDA